MSVYDLLAAAQGRGELRVTLRPPPHPPGQTKVREREREGEGERERENWGDRERERENERKGERECVFSKKWGDHSAPRNVASSDSAHQQHQGM